MSDFASMMRDKVKVHRDWAEKFDALANDERFSAKERENYRRVAEGNREDALMIESGLPSLPPGIFINT